jgi:DeoR/GlpR family transcriptional regulator of sugar metabolism
MLTEKRRSQILAALRQDGLVSIQELSQRFGVSYMTIWRDLDVLIGQGYAQRVRGGAVAAPGETHPPAGSDAHLLPGFDTSFSR